jgi:two-component system OmpR family sensor kinase/two-component system sensor histidine kinase BaeS
VGAHASNLEQVLRNLVVNAEKYSPPGSPIDIDCRSDGPDAVVVRVADQGTGVDPAELELIFQRFYRSARTSSSVGGSGLGLALCKRLVEAMGGTIWAEGREGGGLEVAFRLPAFEPELLD